MDSLSLERIPLPSFRVYLISSLIALSAGIFHILQDDWSQWKNVSSTANNFSGDASTKSRCFHMVDKCLEDTWCFWSLTNFGYGCLMSFALKLQSTVFGQLTEKEQTHIRDRFWNFVFYKIIFMYGVLKVQSIQEITLWIAWSSVLGFLYLLSGLLKDRLELVLHMPATSPVLHLKMTLLLLSVLALGILLAGISLVVGLKVSLQLMFFMFAEVFQLVMSTMHTGTRYCLHFYLETQSSAQDAKNNLHRSIIFYYVDLFFGVLERVVDFLHNLHMLLWNWLQINMSGLIVCLHLQYLYYELSKIHKRHRRYREVAEILSTKIPLAYIQDKCAVCWDVLSPGRQLRCGHVFHDACLRSWIEYMPTCPTCRASIPELAPPRDDTTQETESGATMSSYAASPEGHVPLPFLPPSEQQGQLQSAQPMVATNSSSAGDVSEYAVSPPLSALSTTDANSASRSHESGSGLSGVVAQLADELSLAFAALNNRSCVEASVMQHMSTTVIVNNLVDARRDLLPLRSLRTSDLPVKFLGELEAELMTYLMPSKSTDNGTSDNESSSLPNQPPELPGPSASCPNVPSPSVGTPVMPEITLSLTSSSSESCEDSSEEEFSPRKIVRQAIRVLLVRAGQAAEAAHRLRSMNRRRRRRKTSVCSAQSQLFKELPKGDLKTLSPPVLGEPLTHSEDSSAITATVPCFASQEVDVGPTSLPPADSNHPNVRSAKTLARNQSSSTETQKERMNQLLFNARRRFLKKSFHQS